MFEYLSENEIRALNSVKERYDRHPSETMAIIEPKLNIEIIENVMDSLQNKGYWVVDKKDMDNNIEMVSISLKEKFFAHFNISVET